MKNLQNALNLVADYEKHNFTIINRIETSKIVRNSARKIIKAIPQSRRIEILLKTKASTIISRIVEKIINTFRQASTPRQVSTSYQVSSLFTRQTLLKIKIFNKFISKIILESEVIIRNKVLKIIFEIIIVVSNFQVLMFIIVTFRKSLKIVDV